MYQTYLVFPSHLFEIRQLAAIVPVVGIVRIGEIVLLLREI